MAISRAKGCFEHSCLQVVGHNDPRRATEELERLGVELQPSVAPT